MPQYNGVWTLEAAAQAQSNQQWVTDPNFKSTTLLLQADGVGNGSQNNTFLDSSSNGFPITRNGNVTQGSFTPFSQAPGRWSNFASAASASVGLSNSTAALVSSTTTTFTAECWIYMTEAPVSGDGIPALIGMDATFNTSIYLGFGPNASRQLVLRWFDGASKTATGGTPLALNTWYHIAVVSNANAIAMYVNGVAETLSGTTTLTNRNSTTNTFSLFLNSSASNYQFRGYASNIRVCTSAVYTGAFTPSTAPLTTTSQSATNCRLLTAQNNSFVDNSSNAYVLTLQSTPSVQAFSPFAPQFQWTPAVIGGSGYFNGGSDYLTWSGSTVGTSQFTFECWFYYTGTFSGIAAFVGPGTAVTNALNLYIANSTTFTFDQYGITGINFTVPAMVANTWYHVAFVRGASNACTVFLNGVRSSTGAVTIATNYANIGAIGYVSSAVPRNWLGYLSGVKYSQSAAYDPTQTTITIPTAPPSPTGSNLCLNFTNAVIYDAAMDNVLQTVGNAQVNTSVVKYGSGSMAFDGTGDQLVLPNSQNFEFGSGNHTVECWVYITGTSGSIINYSNGQSSNSNFSWEMYQSSSSVIQYSILEGGTVYQASSSAFSINAWNHIAAVRIDGVLRIYVNGVVGGTTAVVTGVSISVRSGATLKVSGYNNLTGMITGYIDDFRITKGVARYTANFIPPQVALPRQ
jgi:hypothetical protein